MNPQTSSSDSALAMQICSGMHVVTPRRGYLHHGICVDRGRIVHYAGLKHGLHRGPVEEVPLHEFAAGRPVWVLESGPCAFDPSEVVRRARSRVGENTYRVFTNNCEHFCEWCLRGEGRSYQIEALTWPLRALRAIGRAFTGGLVAAVVRR